MWVAISNSLRKSGTFTVPKEVPMGVNTKGQRIGVYIEDDLLSRCDAAIPRTNASSRSEFIRDAVEYYLAVLSAKENSKVLTPALESVIGGKIAGTEERINRIIFKLAVEVAMLNHLYASAYNFDTDDLDWLKEHCRQEVASLNGRINLADIAEEYVEDKSCHD
jgi:metal-responsive CopG/Arc/MetJ family transcriptional regulator